MASGILVVAVAVFFLYPGGQDAAKIGRNDTSREDEQSGSQHGSSPKIGGSPNGASSNEKSDARIPDQGNTASETELETVVFELEGVIANLAAKRDRSAFDHLVELIHSGAGSSQTDRDRIRRVYAARMIPWAAASHGDDGTMRQALVLLRELAADRDEDVYVRRVAVAAIFGLFTSMPREGPYVLVQAWDSTNRDFHYATKPWQQGLPANLVKGDTVTASVVGQIALDENDPANSVGLLAITEIPLSELIPSYRLMLARSGTAMRAAVALAKLGSEGQPELMSEALTATRSEVFHDNTSRRSAKISVFRVIGQAKEIPHSTGRLLLSEFFDERHGAPPGPLEPILARYYKCTRDQEVTETLRSMLRKKYHLAPAARLAVEIADPSLLPDLEAALADPHVSEGDRRELERAVAVLRE